MWLRRTLFYAMTLSVCALEAGCCLFSACIAPDAPSHLTNPQEPNIKDSVVQVPFETADLQPVQQAADNAIERGKDGEGAWGDAGGGLWDKVSWHRDNISVSAHDNVVTLSTRVYFSARLAHSLGGTRVQFAQCGHGEPEASFDIGINVTLTPKSDWSIATDANLFGPTTVIPCHLSVANYDPASKIYPRIRDLAER
jgi:hypothetical protein